MPALESEGCWDDWESDRASELPSNPASPNRDGDEPEARKCNDREEIINVTLTNLETPYLKRKHDFRDQKLSRKKSRVEDATSRASQPQSLGSIQVRPSQLVRPKSIYQGWTPQLSVSSELKAIYDLKRVGRPRNDSEPYVLFSLSDFSIYRTDNGRLENEFCRLDQLTSELCFDGILSVGDEQRYLQKVPFQTLTLEGYGDHATPSVRQNICIQSAVGHEHDIWYQLAEPSEEYERFFAPFAWLADFTKLFVDFLTEFPSARLDQFRKAFHDWNVRIHGRQNDFQNWLSLFGSTDFRIAVVANVAFLWKECAAIIPKAARLPIWAEVDHLRLNDIKPQKRVQTRTLVTPFVHDCFKDMYFSDYLKPSFPESPPLIKAWRQRLQLLGFGSAWCPTRLVEQTPKVLNLTKSCGVGDVVAVSRDDISVWKDKADVWFAYVQNIRENSRGVRFLTVTWLYRPEDTTLSNMRYPFCNELFLSDHCNCEADGTAKLKASDVIGTVEIRWFSNPAAVTQPEIFCVRQKYDTQNNAFSTLRKEDFQCKCSSYESALEAVMAECGVGDTILIEQRYGTEDVLEPVEVINFILEKEAILVRRLLRRGRDLKQPKAAPNELVFTEEFYPVSAEAYKRRCQVRFFAPGSHVPPPYERDGTVDCFYITSRLMSGSTDRLVDLQQPFPDSLHQGFDPEAKAPRKVLGGLALFCGGGNFDRGLEEGGAIRTRWAVDIDSLALHTWRANSKHANDVQFFLGSVDDFLATAMAGRSRSVPGIGEVDHIAAGSPCQGFSSAQQDKQSEASKQNASKIASVLAHIDLYRPKYAMLENVIAMTADHGKKKDQNVFAQALCTLVGMGYQVKQCQLDAWSFGGPQSRSRLFIVATAPGLAQPTDPPLTHSHPPGVRNRGLGKAANDQTFGSRRFDVTPFRFRTARESTADLPHIGDSKVQYCIPFPDHRTAREESEVTASLISHIPVAPPNFNMVKAANRGCLPRPHLDLLARQGRHRRSAISRAWERINGDGLFPTVTTTIVPADSFHGRTVHWDQHRLITVMEARRAQGFRDEEVLLGLPRNQWKIIGNSVARQVALALGMSLREAWLANPPDDTEVIDIEEGQYHQGCKDQKKRLPESDGYTFSRTDVPDFLAPDELAHSDITLTQTLSISRKAITDTSLTSVQTNTFKVSSKSTFQRFSRSNTCKDVDVTPE